MKRTIAGLFAIAAMAGAGLATTAAAASAAPETARALSCKLSWNDANTAGITCTGGTFVGWAMCKNGSRAQGAAAASGKTSYAYCTSYNSSLKIPVQWGAVQVA
ncbi:hypothetical protein [Streptomyces sp. AD55]|uniref:hypothetical protein n=1 Tax=Streptomyces sp. AD55 TaxID=3242895 RepID=UPI0035282E51